MKQTFLHDNLNFWFVSYQVIHLGLLGFIWFMLYKPDFNPDIFQRIPWIQITGLVLVTFPASRIMHAFLSRWQTLEKIEGLSNAGQWIGILERILIVTFLMAGQWEAIGFLLAAKSVFRFGDLKNSKEIHLTEYILIGTLLSFTLAIFTGLLVAYIIL